MGRRLRQRRRRDAGRQAGQAAGYGARAPGVEANRLRVARKAVEVVAPRPWRRCARRWTRPPNFWPNGTRPRARSWPLALIRMAVSDAGVALRLLENKWGVHLSPRSATGLGRDWQGRAGFAPWAGYFGNVAVTRI